MSSDSARAAPVVPSRATVRTLLGYLNQYRLAVFAAVAISLVGAAAALAQPLLARRVMDAVQAGDSPFGWAALLVAILVFASALSGVQRFVLRRAGEDLVLTMRVRLVDRLLRLRVEDLDSRRTGDLISRVGSDTTQLRAVLTSGFVDALAGAVTAVGALVLMVFVDPVLLAVTFAAIGVAIAAMIPTLGRVRVLSRRTQDAVGEMTAGVERVLSAVRTVRAARAEAREATRLTEAARSAYRQGVRLARIEAVFGPIGELAVQGAFLAVLGVGGARVAAGSISIGDLIAFVFLLFLLVQPISAGAEAATAIQTGLGALERIEEVMALPPEGLEPTGAIRLRSLAATSSLPAEPNADRPRLTRRAPTVTFTGVGFGYGPDQSVLQDVTFTAAAGTRTALVGPSGAGKSTVLALIERFYDVTSGTVAVDGQDVRALTREDLRSRIAYVEQESPVLAGTMRDNLTLAAPHVTEAEQLAALESVNLLGIVERSPAGLDAQVGDGGVLLSGGERQRLAIARALLADPCLLLLDEATANLDAANEESMALAVAGTGRDITVLIVAHRLATVVDADRIVVLDAGRVVASGTHFELLEMSDLYRDLAKSQLLA